MDLPMLPSPMNPAFMMLLNQLVLLAVNCRPAQKKTTQGMTSQ